MNLAEGMVSFDVIVASEAKAQLAGYTDYIYYTLQNEIATRNVYTDAQETKALLTYVAESLQYCQDAILKKLGYRTINFKRHRYLMLYRVEGSKVFVEAVYHQSQNYVNSFIHKIK